MNKDHSFVFLLVFQTILFFNVHLIRMLFGNVSFEVSTHCESALTDWTTVILPLLVDAKNVSVESSFLSKCFTAHFTHEGSLVFMNLDDVMGKVDVGAKCFLAEMALVDVLVSS